MEPKFQTSFIPKSPIITSPSVSSSAFSRSRPVSLIPLIATIAFIISLVAAGGLFAYEKILTSQISDSNTALVQAKNSFDAQTLNSIISASDRIKSTHVLLSHHVAVSGLFAALQQNILPKVTFTTLSVGIDDAHNVQFSVAGIAESYAVAAEQSAVFSRMPFVTGQTFSGLGLTDKGQVNIRMQGTVDPSLVSYEHSLNGSQPTQP